MADHSHFQRHPLTRAWATADAALRLVFGDEQVARGAARQIYGVHDHINGHVEARSGLPPTGEGDAHRHYTAHDASLLAWVWATLVDTAETAFTRWVRPFRRRRGRRLLRARCGRSPASSASPTSCSPPTGRRSRDYLDDTARRTGSWARAHESRSVARQVLWFRHRSRPFPARAGGAGARAGHARPSSRRPARDPSRSRRRGPRTQARHLAAARTTGDSHGSPRILPSLYVLMRGPSVGLVGRARAASGAAPLSRPDLSGSPPFNYSSRLPYRYT